jgi:hypothetical protein
VSAEEKISIDKSISDEQKPADHLMKFIDNEMQESGGSYSSMDLQNDVDDLNEVNDIAGDKDLKIPQSAMPT